MKMIAKYGPDQFVLDPVLKYSAKNWSQLKSNEINEAYYQK